MIIWHYSQRQFWSSHLKCHWPVNDNFALQLGYHKKLSLNSQWQFWSSLLKMSLTDQWQFLRQSHWELVKAENHWLIFLIMDIPLMAKCHLPQSMTKIYGQNFKKMSLTMVNDKKIVIYWKVSIHFTDEHPLPIFNISPFKYLALKHKTLSLLSTSHLSINITE